MAHQMKNPWVFCAFHCVEGACDARPGVLQHCKQWVRESLHPYPDLPFLAFFDFLAFFVAKNFLAFLSVFPFFPRDFKGSEERKILAFLGGFPCFLLFAKKQGKEDQGKSEKARRQ